MAGGNRQERARSATMDQTTAADVEPRDNGGDLQCRQDLSHADAQARAQLGHWKSSKASAERNLGFVQGTSIVSPGRPDGTGTMCASLASLTDFPVPNTVITSATLAAATVRHYPSVAE